MKKDITLQKERYSLAAFFEQGQEQKTKDFVREVEVSIPEVFVPFFAPASYKVAYGGRGSGKSWFFATYIILKAMESERRIVCTRMFQASIAQSVHKLLCDVIERLDFLDLFKITDTYISCKSTGSTIVFKGLAINPYEIKSFEGADICWVEEAQNVSREVWRILLPTIRKENAEILVSFNPDMLGDATYQDFVVYPKAKSIVIQANYHDNPYFTSRLREEMEHCKVHDFAEYEHVWCGMPRCFSDAQVFKNRFEIQDFNTPQGLKFYYGVDWGFAKDPSALIRCYILDNVLYVDRELYAVGVELDALPDFFRRMEGLEHIGKARASRNRYSLEAKSESHHNNIEYRNNFKDSSEVDSHESPMHTVEILADCSRPETIHFMRKRGFRIRAAKKWGGSVMDGVAILKGFDKIIIHPKCKHTAEEFRLYSYKVHKNTGEIFPALVDAHNHCIDAIRYALDNFIRGRRAMKITAQESI